MRPRTVVAGAGLLVLLVSVVVGAGVTGGTLEELWVSDTPRDNERNHHPVGVGPNAAVVVAPVAEVPGSNVDLDPEDCSLVRLDPADGSVEWRVTVPPERCFSHALTQPAIADIDGDGALEVVVASTENAVTVYEAADGTARWHVDQPTYGYGRPTVAELLPAAGREVVASDIRGNLVAAHANGTVAWRAALGGTLWERVNVYEAPVVADVTGDGRRDVLVGTTNGPAVLDADGRIQWYRNGTARYLTAATGDEATTVFTSGYDRIRTYDGASGETRWVRELSNTRIGELASVDGDRLIYAGVYGGDVAALDAATGETAWTTQVAATESTVSPPVTADVTGDGRPEVIAVADDGTVAVLDAASGSERAAYERTVPVWTAPTPADLTGDGSAELLVVYGDGRVVALTYAESGVLEPLPP